ncbi:hypothetical protein M378DRAFT_188439 [Amanita muscaria Koide BX008]|uniref:C2H2-type domain-containing protein n=1 Tax=Amanita muscaria (strain Koide BX008) TaxID=946122 RepID=A0A0C2W8B0_AMAMK|nr:hypothetical protein M378DRAFT_188439 [Amanita muscaria Koide BX008]
MPPHRKRFNPRNIPCPRRHCNKFFTTIAAMKCHLHVHRREEHLRPVPNRLASNRSPTPDAPGVAIEDDPPDFSDDSDPDLDALPNWGPGLGEDNHRSNLESVTYHPIMNGRPCDSAGIFLPDNMPPPAWDDPSPDDFSPFSDLEDFEMANLLYSRTQMPKTQISDLMQILARKFAKNGNADQDPPFADSDDLYATIDAIEHGDIEWESFAVSYSGEITAEDNAPWKYKSYDVWFRNPLAVLKQQLSNRDFANEMDYAPKKVRERSTGKQRYQDLMSANWAWQQADLRVAENPDNAGATFCPVVLGSDKTTVSIATGQNDYYPLYLSNGLIHNNVRRAHRKGVTLIAFLALPKTDREHIDSDEFRAFRRHLFHSSLTQILSPLLPAIEKPVVLRCADGHYRCVMFGLGPYIADYPEQVLLACVVQGCTANSKDLDGERGRRTHEHTHATRRAFAPNILWSQYGIVNGITPFTGEFPYADIHELISPDILHQLIKGIFKDHLVTWVEDYIKLVHPKHAAVKILAEIDRRIAAAPYFPDLRRFKEGRGFKQWTGKDSKALMKVYLPAIAGLVPPRMVRAVRYFLEFCYLVRRAVLDDDDIEKIDELLALYHQEREVFKTEGVRAKGFNLPRHHSLTHYREQIIEFGAPNGLCSSITESKHRDAVKDPYRCSSRNEPLPELLLINQRMEKLAAARVNFTARGLLNSSGFGHRELPRRVVRELRRIQEEDDDGGAVDGKVLAEVVMAIIALPKIPRRVDMLAQFLQLPTLREDICRFLYEIENPDRDQTIPLKNIPIRECPEYTGRIYVFPSAVATFYAPSNLSGTAGMYRERIRSTSSWRQGPERRDCVYVEHDSEVPGFRGLHIAQVQLLFTIKYKQFRYPCALVTWFSAVGDEPCPDTGMWRVSPDFDANGYRTTTVIHLDSILHAAHLIGVAGRHHIPHHLKHTDSLSAFKTFYVNKFVDYHTYETIF